MGRNKAPSENTIRMLCGRAAGMCEFEGCGKRLFYDNVTGAEFNNSFVAHIVASSQNGPRGDKILSAQLSDKLENLMLMCADHHKLIDTEVEKYPVEKLKDMKKEHEKKIDDICKLLNKKETEIVRFVSPIKGKQFVDIDYKLASKAVVEENRPASNYGISIEVRSVHNYRSEEYWNDCQKQLELRFEKNIANPFEHIKKSSFSIFSIAPIPLIIKLGELFGDKIPCDVFQKIRMPDSWEWQTKEKTNEFKAEKKIYRQDGRKVALILSLTNVIVQERFININDYTASFEIRAKELGVDCIKRQEDLSGFWHMYQRVCDQITNEYGREVSVDVFPAIPVSAAFEIGRRYMPNAYPKMIIYDECDGFFKTLLLGE